MPHKEYIVFCDESDSEGRFFSHFYGGLVVGSGDFDSVSNRLQKCKQELNLLSEVKWSKVSERYLDKYIELMRAFFAEVAHGTIRVRIMFQQNANVANRQASTSLEERYFKLYYQFIKHAFGFRFKPASDGLCHLRIHLDQLPHTHEGAAQFKGFVHALQDDHGIRKANVKIRKEDISEYCSHDHVLAQCLDVVLWSVTFRLNDKHKFKEPGKKRRGNRTIAKEKLYKTILGYIKTIHPRFNPGISTGIQGGKTRWTMPYLHWSFQPKDSIFNHRLTKKEAPRYLITPDA